MLAQAPAVLSPPTKAVSQIETAVGVKSPAVGRAVGAGLAVAVAVAVGGLVSDGWGVALGAGVTVGAVVLVRVAEGGGEAV